MLKRHQAQVLRRAGHTHVDEARLAAVADERRQIYTAPLHYNLAAWFK
jgi:hypothetical protein